MATRRLSLFGTNGGNLIREKSNKSNNGSKIVHQHKLTMNDAEWENENFGGDDNVVGVKSLNSNKSFVDGGLIPASPATAAPPTTRRSSSVFFSPTAQAVGKKIGQHAPKLSSIISSSMSSLHAKDKEKDCHLANETFVPLTDASLLMSPAPTNSTSDRRMSFSTPSSSSATSDRRTSFTTPSNSTPSRFVKAHSCLISLSCDEALKSWRYDVAFFLYIIIRRQSFKKAISRTLGLSSSSSSTASDKDDVCVVGHPIELSSCSFARVKTTTTTNSTATSESSITVWFSLV